MSNIITTENDKILTIAFNRTHKHNAFDENLLNELQLILDHTEKQSHITTIIITGSGKHFSSGADLDWMQRMSAMSEQENLLDAQKFAHLMATLANTSKTTIAMINGHAIGGGLGIVAACDIAISSHNAKFACPEVKIGLIPAVISPYVINAIGARAARWLFMSAEIIDAQRAYELQLVQYCVPENELINFTYKKAQDITQHAPQSMRATKELVQLVTSTTDAIKLQQLTAKLIALKRNSVEGQIGIKATLNKVKPNWT